MPAWCVPSIDVPKRPRRVVSWSGAEDRSEMSAHEAREDRWDGFGGDEPVIPLHPPLTGSCPASSMRRSKANCRDASGYGSTPGFRPGGCTVGSSEGGATVEDENILKRINELAAEEHELFQKESRGRATEADVERLRHL